MLCTYTTASGLYQSGRVYSGSEMPKIVADRFLRLGVAEELMIRPSENKMVVPPEKKAADKKNDAAKAKKEAAKAKKEAAKVHLVTATPEKPKDDPPKTDDDEDLKPKRLINNG